MPQANVKALIAHVALAALLMPGAATASDPTREQQHEKLDFLVGTWITSHTVPTGDGETTTVEGQAVIEWSVGDSWLRHRFQADFEPRGKVFMTSLMNYSPPKKMYNFYMFDHFGGEAGVFYGDWNDEQKAIVLTAEFTEEDGSTSFQKITLQPVSDNELWFSRAFSNDGEHYHFEAKGVYTRRGD